MTTQTLFDVCPQGVEAVALLVDTYGCNINSQDSLGRTGLHFAAATNNVALAEYLISRGADVNLADFHGTLPLHLASSVNHSKIVSLLARAGANVMAKDSYGKTPLQWVQARLRIIKQYIAATEQHPSTLFEDASRLEVERRAKLLKIQGEVEAILDLLGGYLNKLAATNESSQNVQILASVQQKVMGMSKSEDIDEIDSLLDSLCI